MFLAFHISIFVYFLCSVFNFSRRFIDFVFHLCFFFYNHSCIVVGASKQCYCNFHASTLRLLNPFFPSFFVSLIFFVSISCLLMAYGDKLALKKHCVDVSKYSTNVFNYFLSILFGLAIGNNQSTSFIFLTLLIFKLLNLWICNLLYQLHFGFNYIVHDYDMWAIIDHVESCDVVEPSTHPDFSIEPNLTFFTSFYNPYVVLIVEDFDYVVHSESFIQSSK